MADYTRLRRIGRLIAETGLTHTEINAMDGERVEQLLVVMDTTAGWHEAQQERESRKWQPD